MLVVTSFNAEGYDLYGKNFLNSFKANFPLKAKLRAYYHDFPLENPLKAKNISYKSLDPLTDRGKFISKFGAATGNMMGEYNYRMDAIKFCNKVFALIDAAENFPRHHGLNQWLVWLDGDIVVEKTVEWSWLEKIFDPSADIIYLNRKAINYAETSFVAFNLASKKTIELISDLRDLYLSGELFGYAQWHDGFVLTRLIELHKWHGLRAKSLSDHVENLEAFNGSILGEKMSHLKGDKKSMPGKTGNSVPLRIIPHNSVPDETIFHNIRSNVALLKKWLHKKHKHDGVALIVSGGPSVKWLLPEIKENLAKYPNAKLFCVKHSHNTLLEGGIVPYACVLLDPRPFDGISTHGFKRSDLIAEPHPDTYYMVASMTNPDVTKHLISKNAQVVGWHAYTKGVEALAEELGKVPMIAGGTSAAMRSFSIAGELGFRDFHLFGFDCCYYEGIDETAKDTEGRPKYMKASVGKDGKSFWSTGELLAQVQDLETLYQQAPGDLKIEMHGEGLGPEIIKHWPRVMDPLFDGTP